MDCEGRVTADGHRLHFWGEGYVLKLDCSHGYTTISLLQYMIYCTLKNNWNFWCVNYTSLKLLRNKSHYLVKYYLNVENYFSYMLNMRHVKILPFLLTSHYLWIHTSRYALSLSHRKWPKEFTRAGTSGFFFFGGGDMVSLLHPGCSAWCNHSSVWPGTPGLKRASRLSLQIAGATGTHHQAWLTLHIL